MIPIEIIITIGFLIVISFIDIFIKSVPSILTYTFIIFNLFFIEPTSLLYGIILLVFALLLMEFPNEKQAFFSGGADLKVMFAIGLVMRSKVEIAIFIISVMEIGLLYKSLADHYLSKKSKHREIAFIPVFLISYLLTLLIGGI